MTFYLPLSWAIVREVIRTVEDILKEKEPKVQPGLQIEKPKRKVMKPAYLEEIGIMHHAYMHPT